MFFALPAPQVTPEQISAAVAGVITSNKEALLQQRYHMNANLLFGQARALMLCSDTCGHLGGDAAVLQLSRFVVSCAERVIEMPAQAPSFLHNGSLAAIAMLLPVRMR